MKEAKGKSHMSKSLACLTSTRDEPNTKQPFSESKESRDRNVIQLLGGP